jgi:hypothetical protein
MMGFALSIGVPIETYFVTSSAMAALSKYICIPDFD